MRLRYGIPLTLGLLILTAVISTSRVNLYYVLVGATAAWIAFDSRRTGIRRHAHWMAQPPLALGVAAVIAWPLFFPTYLNVRHLVRAGRIPIGAPPRRIPDGVTAVLAFTLIVGTVGFATGIDWARSGRLAEFREQMLPLAQALAREHGRNVHISLPDAYHVVVTIAAVDGDTAMQMSAWDIARQVHLGRKPEPLSVVVRFVDSDKRGIATITRVVAAYEWSYRQLREGSD